VSEPSRARHPANRLNEMLAVLMLGIATIGTAWCGYQASRWNSEQESRARHASDLRVEANRQFGLATQGVLYDVNIVSQYAVALSDGDARLQDFFKTTLIRADFLPVLGRWEEAVAAGDAPPPLLEDRAYLDAQLAGYEETQAAAEAADLEASEAGDNADEYVLMTLLLATALFFAGVTTSFKVPAARLMLLTLAALAIAYSLSRIATLAVA
jgi:hypothetical protein